MTKIEFARFVNKSVINAIEGGVESADVVATLEIIKAGVLRQRFAADDAAKPSSLVSRKRPVIDDGEKA